jgi:hypothetical protein
VKTDDLIKLNMLTNEAAVHYRSILLGVKKERDRLEDEINSATKKLKELDSNFIELDLTVSLLSNFIRVDENDPTLWYSWSDEDRNELSPRACRPHTLYTTFIRADVDKDGRYIYTRFTQAIQPCDSKILLYFLDRYNTPDKECKSPVHFGSFEACINYVITEHRNISMDIK